MTVAPVMSHFFDKISAPITEGQTYEDNSFGVFKKMNNLSPAYLGAQWLSGRVLDSRPKGRGLEPHRRHCVVVLEQDTFILA